LGCGIFDNPKVLQKKYLICLFKGYQFLFLFLFLFLSFFFSFFKKNNCFKDKETIASEERISIYLSLSHFAQAFQLTDMQRIELILSLLTKETEQLMFDFSFI